MTDDFETRDTAPIVASKGITFRSWHFSLRELGLGLVAASLLVACVVLAGFLGKTSTELKEAQTSKEQNHCRDSACFRTSAYIMKLMNASVDPCDNFFEFACGGYRTNDPVSGYTSASWQTKLAKEDMLSDILNSPPSPQDMEWSSVKKMKEFYASCRDEYLRGVTMRGHIKGIMRPFTSIGWNLDNALKRVQTDAWVNAMYTVRVQPDPFHYKEWVIRINPAERGRYMDWNDYAKKARPYQKKLQDNYRKLIRTVFRLSFGFAANVNQSLNKRIETVVSDVYEVESNIAQFDFIKADPSAIFKGEEWTLTQLTKLTGGKIDWTVQMSYLFDQKHVTGDTKVIVPYPSYFTNLAAMLKRLDSRKIDNYLRWRFIQSIVEELPCEYNQAILQFYSDTQPMWSGASEESEEDCVTKTERVFYVALSALYVKTRFGIDDRKKVQEITETIQSTLVDTVKRNEWMDQTTKTHAIAKVLGAKYRIGFPDFVTDKNKVNSFYEELTINYSDYLGNVLAANMQHKRDMNLLLLEGVDRNWGFFKAYDSKIRVAQTMDEIIVPAGYLLFPMYERNMPHYYSFGAFGARLARHVLELIDVKGRRFTERGEELTSPLGWWSNSSAQNYTAMEQCVIDLYSNQTQGPYYYVGPNGELEMEDVLGYRSAREAMTATSGIRIAFNAYQAWLEKHGQDSYSPGLNYNPQQLFFIAHAQSHCDVGHAALSVNMAFKELPEFGQAFQCQTSDNMVSAQPCTYY